MSTMPEAVSELNRTVQERSKLVTVHGRSTCHHFDVHEIGRDLDREGRLISLLRCQNCGLLMRRYVIES